LGLWRLSQENLHQGGRVITVKKPVTSIAVIEKAIGIKADRWVSRCHEIAGCILRKNLVPSKSRLCYGNWMGAFEEGSPFHGRAFTHHGWIELPDGRVYDPTRWVFEQVKPYIYVGANDHYDDCAEELRAALHPSGMPEPQGKTVEFPVCSVRTLRRFLPVVRKNHVHLNQIFWLANQPLAHFRGHERAVFKALVRATLGTLIPFDQRRKVLHDC